MIRLSKRTHPPRLATKTSLSSRQKVRDQHRERLKALTKAELQQSSGYAGLYDCAPVGYVILTATGRVHDINLTGAELLNRSREAIVGHLFSRYLTKASVSSFRQHLTLWKRNDRGLSLEVEVHCRRAAPLPVQLLTRRMAASGNGELLYCTAIIDISVRRRSEQAMRFLSRIVESSEDAIIGLQADATIATWNAGAERIFGYRPDEIVGKDVTVLDPRGRDGKLKRVFLQARRGRPVRQFETCGCTSDGNMVHASWTASPLKDRNDCVAAVSLIARDITARKRAETSLEAHRARLETSFGVAQVLSTALSLGAAAPAILKTICENTKWDFGALWRVNECGRKMKLVELWHRRSLKSRSFISFTRNIEFKKGEGVIGAVWANGRPRWLSDCQVEREFLGSDEAKKAGLHTFVACPIALGKEVLGVIALSKNARLERDIASLKLITAMSGQIAQFIRRGGIEEQLKQSEERYRALVENAPGIAWVSQPDGSWEYVNEQWTSVTGQPADEALGGGWSRMVYPEDVQPFTNAWLNTLRTGKNLEVQIRLHSRSKSYRWFLVRAIPSYSRDGKILRWMGRSTDIHEQKQIEQRTQFLLNFERQIRQLKEPDDILRESVKLMCRHIEASRCAYIEVHEESDSAIVRHDYAQGLSSFAGSYRLSKLFADVSDRFRAGETIVVADVENDVRTARQYSRTYRPLQIRAYMAVPILKDKRWVAVMTTQSKAPRKWSPHEISLLHTIAEHTGLALENAALYREMQQQIAIRRKAQEDLRRAHLQLEAKVRERTADLRRANRELFDEITERNRLEKEILEISERERRRFGQDLHDDLCQRLSGISMMSKALAKKLRQDNVTAAEEADNVADLMAAAVSEARTLARGLHSVELDSSGLTAALRELAITLNLQIGCELEIQEPVSVADSATALHLYRIAQEATANVVRHATAEHLVIKLARKKSTVILTVKDDGAGFARSFSRSHGMGLHIMGYRARLVGGSLSIKTKRGRGTTITCTVPNVAEQ
jgi:PAS domain S-box-containing protein